MGDMADMIVDGMMDYPDEPYDAYQEYLAEESFMTVWQIRGPGPCPECRGETHLINGQYGKFYGCNKFPKCRGSRNY